LPPLGAFAFVAGALRGVLELADRRGGDQCLHGVRVVLEVGHRGRLDKVEKFVPRGGGFGQIRAGHGQGGVDVGAGGLVRLAIWALLMPNADSCSMTPTRSALVRPVRCSFSVYCSTRRSTLAESVVASSAATTTGTLAVPAATAARVRR